MPLIVAFAFTALMVVAQEGPPTPSESLAALRLADPNLRVELVAAEPLVRDPVAIAWDEHGALYVAEMGDYPADGPGGRIKRLIDRDGDGVYDEATVFAEGLAYPSGVAPYRGGVIVTAAPDLLWLRDTDGDGKADEREVLLTGFGEGNQQLRVNSPTWGLDNWLYLANGRSGGAVRKPSDPPEAAIPIPRNDVRFDPRTGRVEAIAGFSQFGLPRDDWGNRFPSWNTVPIRHVVLEELSADAARWVPYEETRTVADILDMADGGRIYSQAPTPATFNNESVAYFNASCGPTIYRDRLLGDDYAGDAFVCEPLTSVVHRRKLEPDGVTFQARRVEKGVEFLASTHPWFRPVNLTTGPDGALYVVDFCRAWVEHPAFVPEERRGEADFREGNDRGRIWRVVPRDGVKAVTRWPGAMSDEERVALLDSPNGWMRDTAQRLMVETCEGAKGVIEQLGTFVTDGRTALGRAHALWVLRGLSRLDPSLAARAYRDADPGVRQQVVELLARMGQDRLLPHTESIGPIAEDPDGRVRLRGVQIANDIGDVEGLAKIAAQDVDDIWTTRAVLRDLAKERAELFLNRLVAARPDWLTNPTEAEGRLLARLGACSREAYTDPYSLAGMLKSLSDPGQSGSFAYLSGLLRGEEGKILGGKAPGLKDRVLGDATKVLSDPARDDWVRLAAIELLGDAGTPVEARHALMAILNDEAPIGLQVAAARALVVGTDGGENSIEAMTGRWDGLPVAVRQVVLGMLTQSAERARLLLDAIDEERIAPVEIDRAMVENLRALNADDLKARVDALPAARPVEARVEVLAAFDGAATRSGDPERGAALFAQHCQSCHARDGDGARVGPDLIGVVGKPARDLLVSILDPNRDVPPDGIGFVVGTKSGQVYSGLLLQEAAERLVLRVAGGGDEVIPRAEIEAVRSTGRSLMPEGFEQTLREQELADLITFLRSPQQRVSR